MATDNTTSDIDGKRKLRATCRVLDADYAEALAEATALTTQNLRTLGANCITVAHSLFEADRGQSSSPHS